MGTSRLALVALLVTALVATASSAATPLPTMPRPGGTVVFETYSAPACLNPLLAACSGSSAQFSSTIEEVLPGAFAPAPDFRPRPGLVARATFTRKPPYVITYEIRRDARWSDGIPVIAGDFVFTHRAIVRYLVPDPSGGIHQLVQSIRALDAKTVRVVLRAPSADWRLGLFPFVLPQHALAGAKLNQIWTDGIDDPATGDPIGSGPFLVARWERGGDLTLARNPRYWGPHAAYLDRLVLRFCHACNAPPPAEVLGSLRRGAVGIALSRDTGIVPELRRIPGIEVVPLASNGWEHLALRLGPGGHPALGNKLVRQALAYGIDRLRIARTLFGDIERTPRPSDSAVFLNTSRYYVPNWRRYRYRPALARSLLERAGCSRGADGVFSCAGQRLSLRFLTISGSSLRDRGVELVQSQLRKVGIDVRLTFATGPALFSQILPGGDFDAVSFAWFVDFTIGGKSTFGCGGAQNEMGYCRRAVTHDLDQADRILDERQRARVLNRVDRRMAQDVPVIPLYQIPYVLAYQKTLRGVVPSAGNLLWKAEDWWLAPER